MGQYSPQEPATTLDLERATFIGDTLSVLAYGASLVLYLQCLRALAKRRDMNNRWGVVLYTTAMFGCSTVFIALNSTVWRNMFVDDRDYPGGPIGYSLGIYNQPIVVAANAAFVISNWLADGLLLYRCFVVYGGNYWVVALPSMIYLASISMGIILQYATSRPAANAWTQGAVHYGLAYFCLSCSLNILLTLIIAARILVFRQRVHRVLGSEHTTPYVSVATMLIESSALYAFFSMLFIAPYASGSNLSNIFLPILSQIQVIAPLLIVLRVADRSAWTADTGTVPTKSLAFTQPSSEGETRRTEAREHHQRLSLQFYDRDNPSLKSSLGLELPEAVGDIHEKKGEEAV